jgi:hypothetical protein
MSGTWFCPATAVCGAHEADGRPRMSEKSWEYVTANAACAAALCASDPMNDSMNSPPMFIAMP